MQASSKRAGLDGAPIWSKAGGLSEANLAAYLDLPRVVRVGAPILLQTLRTTAPQLDWASAPTVEEMVALLEPECTTVRFGADRWTVRSYSPTSGALPVALSGIGAAIVIPSLLRSRMSANEARASGALLTIAQAQELYRQSGTSSSYADSLQRLATGERGGGSPLIDEALASGIFNGYEVTMQAGGPVCSKSDAPAPSEDTTAWDPAVIEVLRSSCESIGGTLLYTVWRAEAHPIIYQRTGVRSFFIDQSGKLHLGDIKGHVGTLDLPEY